jgi:hypothetical protein
MQISIYPPLNDSIMINRKTLSFLLCCCLLLTLTACAPENYTTKEYGFFNGIWHGICFPFALIGKLFGSDIGLYAEHNSGFLYWLGLIFGLGILGGGGAGSR